QSSGRLAAIVASTMDTKIAEVLPWIWWVRTILALVGGPSRDVAPQAGLAAARSDVRLVPSLECQRPDGRGQVSESALTVTEAPDHAWDPHSSRVPLFRLLRRNVPLGPGLVERDLRPVIHIFLVGSHTLA